MDFPFLHSLTYRSLEKVTGFNPCSYGFSVLTPGSNGAGTTQRKFQSLFLWIFRSYTLNKLTISTFKVEFQSLFLWIFRSYQIEMSNMSFTPHVFQSLFLWIFRSYGRGLSPMWTIDPNVSILVLMDFPFLQNGEWDE